MNLQELLEEFNQPLWDADGCREISVAYVRRSLTKIGDLI